MKKLSHSTKKVVTELVLTEALLAREGAVNESVADVARRHNVKPNTLSMHVLRYTRTIATRQARQLRRERAKKMAKESAIAKALATAQQHPHSKMEQQADAR